MCTPTFKVSHRGVVTVPAAIRKHLELRAGDKVVFEVHGQGPALTVTMRKAPREASSTDKAGTGS